MFRLIEPLWFPIATYWRGAVRNEAVRQALLLSEMKSAPTATPPPGASTIVPPPSIVSLPLGLTPMALAGLVLTTRTEIRPVNPLAAGRVAAKRPPALALARMTSSEELNGKLPGPVIVRAVH